MEARAGLWSQGIFLLVLFSLIAALVLTPLISNTQIPRDLDYQNHLIAIMQAKTALLEGQFPIRTAHYQAWRYPLFQFYSPTSYTLAGLIYLWVTPSSPLLAEKILLWFFLVISGVYFYRLAYDFVRSSPAATLSAVAYLTMPYYLITINYIGALNEALALSIFPVVLYYTLRRYAVPEDTRTLLTTSLLWYLIFTIHLVTAVVASFFVGLLLLLMTCQNRKWVNLIDVGVAYLFGCFLAMWYLAPIALLHASFLISNSFSNDFYKIYEVYAADLFSLTGHLTQGVKNAEGNASAIASIHPNLGLPILFALGICFFMLLKKLRGRGNFLVNKKFDYWLPGLLLVFSIGFLLVWSPVNFWRWLPPSFFLFQYTLRLLGQLMWLGALLFAGAICWVFKNRLDARHTVCGVIFLIAIAFAWFPTGKWGYMDFGRLMKNPFYAYNNDYLIDARRSSAPLRLRFDKPVGQEKIPQLFISATYKFDPARTLTVKQMKPDCQQEKTTTICKVMVPEKINLIELPVLAYPDMLRISVNGRAVAYRSIVDRDFYIAAIQPEPGKFNTIKIQFNGLGWANLLSGISWAVWVLFFCIVFLTRTPQPSSTNLDQSY